MKRIILVLAIIACIILSGCQKIVRETEIEITATVTETSYHAPYTTFMSIYNGRTTTLIPQNYPEQYLVTISYEDISGTFNNRSLYEQVTEGDKIQAILYQAYNEDNELVKKSIYLPE